MLSFFSRNRATEPAPAEPPPAPAPASEPHPLDALTGGVFCADSSADRQARVLAWLASEPEFANLQTVYKALSVRDKGAAKPIRQRMNEIRQSQQQDEAAHNWAEKAEKILAASNFHIADAMAWLRDAAKAGAPLSKEPLATLRARIAEQIKALEDLQHKAMVQKEAAVLVAQRIDVLSTKPWRQAAQAQANLSQDVQKWASQVDELLAAPLWSSVEPRHANAVESARTHLQQVFEAFSAALAQAEKAFEDAQAPLPQVPIWAEELRVQHGLGQAQVTTSSQPQLTPEQIADIGAAVTALEETVAKGQAAQSSAAAAALRERLKEAGAQAEPELERRINQTLIDAGDLQGWQRWGANQVREELIARAEKLLEGADGQAQAGGKQLQNQVRELNEQWRQVDRSSPPNGDLWKRFDAAISKARAVVDEWLKKVKAEAQAHKGERQALIDEVKAYAQSQSEPVELKSLQRQLQQFASRWRASGHVNDKVYAALQAQWRQAFDAAAAPLEQARKQSIELRRNLIEQGQQLAAAKQLDVRAVKALQQRWQAEAQSVPLERKLEQKLWDAFRQPLDEAFNRKGEQRSQAQAVTSAHDKAVLQASEALDTASASGNAMAIREAMQALQDALQAVPETAGVASTNKAVAAEATAPQQTGTAETVGSQAEQAETPPSAQAEKEQAPEGTDASAGQPAEAPEAAAEQPAEPAASPAAPAPLRKVVAVRGDDRPGALPKNAAHAARATPGDKRGERRGAGPERGRDRSDRDPRGNRDGRQDRSERAPTAPRLGDQAYRAQRNALEHAQAALRNLSMQAHGEALSELLQAWSQRQADKVPAQAQLSRKLSASQWNQWKQQIGQAAGANAQAATALLRLEMAAEVPTPADHLSQRRALQLQLLTQRNAASPQETWVEDVASVLATAADDSSSKRLQNALKVLLKRG